MLQRIHFDHPTIIVSASVHIFSFNVFCSCVVYFWYVKRDTRFFYKKKSTFCPQPGCFLIFRQIQPSIFVLDVVSSLILLDQTFSRKTVFLNFYLKLSLLLFLKMPFA